MSAGDVPCWCFCCLLEKRSIWCIEFAQGHPLQPCDPSSQEEAEIEGTCCAYSSAPSSEDRAPTLWLTP